MTSGAGGLRIGPRAGRCPACSTRVSQKRTCTRCGSEGYFCTKHFSRRVCHACRGRLTKAEKVLRGKVFETPQQALDDLLAEEALQNPALVRASRPAPEEDVEEVFLPGEAEAGEAEEDEGPELLGEGGEEFHLDPDGDWSEHDEPLRIPGETADLVIYEISAGGKQIELRVGVPGVPAWRCDERLKGTPVLWRARRLLQFVQERQERLKKLGELLIDRQESFLRASDADQAWGCLQELTQEEAARKLGGIDASLVNRLVRGRLLLTPRLGLVPLENLFVRRPQILAERIRELAARKPEMPLTASAIRMEIWPTLNQPREKESAERLIRRALARIRAEIHQDRKARQSDGTGKARGRASQCPG